MIKFEYTDVQGMKHAIRGMRNPLNSWAKSDSGTKNVSGVPYTMPNYQWRIGPNDRKLAESLIKAGPEHAKFLRQIVCWVDITAPRFWWIEFDTYRNGVEKNSCSTMHTIMKRPFSDADFSGVLPGGVIADLNLLREGYLASDDDGEKKFIWRRVIERLPQSYHQKRTVMMSYQAIRQMCIQRRNHKLEEWHDFISWAKKLPESWMLMENEEDDC